MSGVIIGPCAELGLPGADDEEILVRILSSCERHEQFVRNTVQTYLSGSAADHAAAAAMPADIDRSVHEFLTNHPSFSQLLMCLVAESYYQDGRVLQSLDMEARPPFPQGRVVEQSDWSLLDAVKRREALYRPVPSEAS